MSSWWHDKKGKEKNRKVKENGYRLEYRLAVSVSEVKKLSPTTISYHKQSQRKP
jgi:hypothetical protein